MSVLPPVMPRALCWRGRVDAAGFWLDLGLIGEAEARRRVLALWAHGPRVLEGDGGWLVRLGRPCSVRAEDAPGVPLVELKGALSATPLQPDERKALAIEPGSVIRLVDGVACRVSPTRLRPVEPARWVDLSAWVEIPTEPLGPPPRPVVVAPSASPEALRKRLGMGGAADALSGARALQEALSRGTGVGTGLGGRLMQALGQGAGWLARRLESRKKASPGGETAIEPAPGLLDRMALRLERWAARTALGQQITRMAGSRYGRQLQELVGLFEEGNLAEALRRALPLSSGEAGGGDPMLRGLLAGLPLRDSLSLGGARVRGLTREIGLSSDLFDFLKQLYRRAFEELDRRGQVEEAAFVLAELLDAPEEAVAYLERNERLALAAELAEARRLPPGLSVRLWLQAGELDRAVRIARMQDAWADAVSRLEVMKEETVAFKLRVVWAGSLAATGNPAGALVALGPRDKVPAVALQWAARARMMGGEAAARAIAWQAGHQPELLEELLDEVLDLVEVPEPTGPRSRMALVRALEASPSKAGGQLARPLVRAVLRDLSEGATPEIEKQLQNLLREVGDPAFAGDLPPLPRATPPSTPLHHAWRGGDVGATPIHDAALLPDGSLLLAIGEAGVIRVDRLGRVLRRFAAPAFDLVLQPEGARVLGLAGRGDRMAVSQLRLDEEEQPAVPALLPVIRWPERFDGGLWFAAGESTLYAWDLLDPGTDGTIRALWKVDLDPGQRVRVLRWEPQGLAALVDCPKDGLQWWRWSLPGPVLRERVEIHPTDAAVLAVGLDPRQVFAAGSHSSLEASAVQLLDRSTTPVRTLFQATADDPFRNILGLGVSGAHLAMQGARDGDGWQLRVVRASDGALVACHEADALAMRRQRHFRLQDDLLLVFDQQGRLAVLDLAARTLRLDLRL